MNTQRRPRLIIGSVVAGLLLAGVLAVVAPGSSNAVLLPQPITLTFAGQVTGDQGLGNFTTAHPPIEGGVNRIYTVPPLQRLVIESVYVQVDEFVPVPYSGRSGIQAGVSTWYDLGKNCAFPGWERDYGVTLQNPISQTVGLTTEKHFLGNLAGPIFVEAGRSVNGLALAPGSDDQVWVKVVVHGHLEASLVNPTPPTCG